MHNIQQNINIDFERGEITGDFYFIYAYFYFLILQSQLKPKKERERWWEGNYHRT